MANMFIYQQVTCGGGAQNFTPRIALLCGVFCAPGTVCKPCIGLSHRCHVVARFSGDFNPS